MILSTSCAPKAEKWFSHAIPAVVGAYGSGAAARAATPARAPAGCRASEDRRAAYAIWEPRQDGGAVGGRRAAGDGRRATGRPPGALPEEASPHRCLVLITVSDLSENAAADRVDVMSKTSRFRGIYKDKMAISKPWMAKIGVTEDGKGRQIRIASFAREEDAARAYDRVRIAKLGHAEANTNFPAKEYREEWAELEALGVDAAAARERQRAK